MTPDQAMSAGRDILDQVLLAHGFQFELGETGRGSGGHFANAAYSRGNRRLEFSFRWSLGLVTYRLGTASASHDALVRAMGAQGQNQYPGFSDDPLDGFRHLRADLEHFGGVFLNGSDEELDRMISLANQPRASRLP